MSLPTKTNGNSTTDFEAVIAKGDLSKLTPEQRVDYYNATCKSLGLNPLTKPFEYHNLNGRLILYANRSAADQLRKLHGITISIVSQDYSGGMLSIHVKAIDKTGREDEDLGVVPFSDALKGEARANQIMKAVTKAKRRVTLSISGLGWLDETEVESIPRDNPNVTLPGDIVNVPGYDDPSYIPGEPSIKSLPKKDLRANFEIMQKELYKFESREALQQWRDGPLKETFKLWPEDWQDIFRGLYSAHFWSLPGPQKYEPTQQEDPDVAQT